MRKYLIGFIVGLATITTLTLGIIYLMPRIFVFPAYLLTSFHRCFSCAVEGAFSGR